MKKEIWKDIPNYEGYYQVSNLGNVLNTKRKKMLNQQISKGGYKRVFLSNKGKIKAFLVHRLVAQAFITNPNNLPQINHKDENKLNNYVNNLEWCNCKYNNNYGTRNIRLAKTLSKQRKGIHYSTKTEFKKEQTPWNKNINTYYSAKKVKCIELNKTYNSITEASKELNLLMQNICRSCKSNYKVGGYTFEYE